MTKRPFWSMKSPALKPSAFTLVELLVVIAIIATLIGLLLPAVQSVRESARATTCRNHLKHLGLAVQSHESAYRSLPGGGYPYTCDRMKSNDSPATFKTQTWSWLYQILPFLEEQQIWSDLSDETVAAKPVVHFFCPTRRSPIAIKGGYWAATNTYRGMTDYAGNAGTANDGNDGGGIYGHGRDGAFCLLELGNRKLVHFTDGLSQSLLAGEKRMNVRYIMTDQQPDDNCGYVGGFQDDVVRWGPSNTPWGSFTPAPDLNDEQYRWDTLHPSTWQFGSSHIAGIMAVFCDGSVRSLAFDVEPLTFERLCSISDGEQVAF
jgi:prepilin-type N-terminal cleavage/methylation domain-containing protein